MPLSHPSPGGEGPSCFFVLLPQHLPGEKGKQAAVHLVNARHGYITSIYVIINHRIQLISNQRVTAFGAVFNKLWDSGLVRDRVQVLIEVIFESFH